MLARLLWDPWLLAVLLVAAAIAGAVGNRLTGAGSSSGIAVSLSGAIPQLLCLVIVGRVIAALLLPDGTAPAVPDGPLRPCPTGPFRQGPRTPLMPARPATCSGRTRAKGSCGCWDSACCYSHVS